MSKKVYNNSAMGNIENDHDNKGVYSPIIGVHHSSLSQKFGIPRQPNLVNVISCIEMYAPYNTLEAFIGLEGFSHLWVTWQAHHNREQDNFKPCVRPPRLGGNKKLGVFATRSTYRPSSLGLSVVKLIHLEVVRNGVILHIMGADMVDGTPIIDIKPYIAYSDSLVEAVSGFAVDKPSIKLVQMSEKANAQFANLSNLVHELVPKDNAITGTGNDGLDHKTLTPESKFYPYVLSTDKEVICQLIAQDPRPAYQHHDTERVYLMRYKNVDVHFKMTIDTADNETLVILEISEWR